MRISTLLAKRVYGKIPVWTLILLVVSLAGVRAAVLFTHNFNVPPTAPTLTSTCPGTLEADPSTGIAGTGPGTVLFSCPSGEAALSASGGTAIPSFAIPTGMSLALAYYSLTLPDSCVPGNIAAVLASGSPISFGGSGLPIGLYDYCLSYPSFPSSGVSFTVTWSQ